MSCTSDFLIPNTRNVVPELHMSREKCNHCGPGYGARLGRTRVMSQAHKEDYADRGLPKTTSEI